MNTKLKHFMADLGTSAVWVLQLALMALGGYLLWKAVFWLLHTVLSAIVLGGHH